MTKFRHPLLVLMPYAASAPLPLRILQVLVGAVLNVDTTVALRVSRVRRLHDYVVRNRSEIPGHVTLLIEVLELAAATTHSPLVSELLALALLQHGGFELVEPAACSSDVELPSLTTRGRHAIKVDAISPESDVARRWRSALVQLRDVPGSQIGQMTLADVESGIRIIRNYTLFAKPSGAALSLTMDRLEFFERCSSPVWGALNRRRKELAVGAPSQFGDASMELVHHHLCSAVRDHREAVSELASTVGNSRATAGHIVVRGEIPPATTIEDKDPLKRYDVLKSALPVAQLPPLRQLEQLARTLEEEFPWATEAVRCLSDELIARSLFGALETGAPPTLLVGPPGCGKSRLVRRFSEELGLAFLPLSFAGMSDSRVLLGTARGWSSAQASPLIDLLVARQTASALVLVDEIDKASGQTGNCVPPTVALLGLLEPENARQWYDSYLQTPCDLSKLMFWATANTLSPLSKPLLSRFRIVLVPEPRPEHFETIAHGAITDIAGEWGVPTAVLPTIAVLQEAGRPTNAREIKAWARRRLQQWSIENLHPSKVH